MNITVSNDKEDALFAVLQDRAEIELAIRRIASGKFAVADFADRAKVWKERATLFSACQMIRHDFAVSGDFKAKAQMWIDSATPGLAAKMIRHGLAKPDDFIRRFQEWMTHPQYSFWRDFVRAAPDDDLRHLVDCWIRNATFESAMGLVADGLAAPIDFAPRVSSWADYGPKDRLQTMASLGLMSRDDADDTMSVSREVHAACGEGRRIPDALRRDCLQFGDGSAVHKLLAAGAITQSDCLDRIEEWVGEASAESAPYLVRYGFASAEEMRSSLAGDFQTLTVEQAYRLVPAKVLSKDDIEPMRDRWRMTLSPETLHMAYALGVVSGDEAVAMFRIWGDEGMMEEPRFARLVRSRLDTASLVGRRVVGRFKTYRDGGAVIRVNGFDGFVMQSEFGWLRAERVASDFRWGDMVECVISRFSQNELLLRLARTCDPASSVSSQFPVGKVVRGTVSSVKDYGIFVDIAPGLSGFVFRGEIGWSRRSEPVASMFKVGDAVDAVVTSVDEENRKISLSIRQTTQDPWLVAEKNCLPGTRIKGKVVGRVGQYGLAVEVAPGVQGHVHRTEVSWRDRDSRAVPEYAPGDEVDVVVKRFNISRRCLELSIRAAQPNPWDGVESRYPVGSVVRGVVRRRTRVFAFVELQGGISALLHRREVGASWADEMPYSAGDEIEARVVYSSSRLGSLILSVRALSMPDDDFAELADQVRHDVESRPSRRMRP